jgi:hypothetical protein
MTYLDHDLAAAVIEARVVAARERQLAHQATKDGRAARRLARRLARRQDPSLWARWFARTDPEPTTAAASEAAGRLPSELAA